MLTTRLASRLLPALVAAALLLPAPSAGAQVCFGPDNLDVPGACCVPVIPNLPPFPAISMGGLGICWNTCSVAAQRTLKVQWNTPFQPQCAQYTTPLLVTDSTSGAAMLTGTMVLDYTRTWDEITTTGLVQQVWRFTAKADLSVPAGGGAPFCPTPSCIAPAGPHPTAFFYGYVDYTCVQPGAGYEATLVLYHACDRFIHQPGLSDKPGVFHPGISYAIVAPHSTVQPFIPANTFASAGPVFGEATRDVVTVTPPPGFCISEDRVNVGNMTLLGAGCVCTMTANPKQQSLRDFRGQTACVNAAGLPGGWASLNVNFPTLPWFHMVSTSIGFWSNPNVFPGQEHVWVDEGLFVHQSACTGDFVEMKYGASTRDGWQPLLPIPIVVDDFTDLADNWTAPLFGPYPLPILGSVRPTDHLIYVNLP